MLELVASLVGRATLRHICHEIRIFSEIFSDPNIPGALQNDLSCYL